MFIVCQDKHPVHYQKSESSIIFTSSWQDADETQIALSIEVPYYLLTEWHAKVDKSDPEASGPNYISLVNELIPGHCAQLYQGFGEHINSNFAKKAGSVKSLYRNAKNSRERNQLEWKTLKLTFLNLSLSQWKVLKMNLCVQDRRLRSGGERLKT